jgi:hypothetical protein
VCAAFFRQFLAIDNVQSRLERGERPTYWPDIRASSDLPAQSTCSDLLDHYDWEFASVQMSLHDLGDDEGPYLVIYAPSSVTSGSSGLLTASMNLSRFPDSEIPRAFRLWAYLVAADPGRWSARAHIGYLREDLRNFLLSYSNAMISFFISPAEASKRGIVPDQGTPAKGVTDHAEVFTFGPGHNRDQPLH